MRIPDTLYDQILLFGDSITEFSENQQRGFGFAPAVRHDYIRRLDVVNRGLSGYNTDLALKALPYIMPWGAKVQLMTIFLGANDSCYPVDDPQWNQCVPLEQFKQNILNIVHHERVVAHSPRIILITPPPIDERQQFMIDQAKGFTQPRRSAQNTKAYADAVHEVASVIGAPVLDMWSRFMEYAGWRPGEPLCGDRNIPVNEKFLSLFVDGLHLSPQGYQLMYEGFVETVEANFPELSPPNLPMRLPIWNEFPPFWEGPVPKKALNSGNSAPVESEVTS